MSISMLRLRQGGQVILAVRQKLQGRPQMGSDMPWTAEQLEDLPEHVAANRAKWDRQAVRYAERGERAWRLQPGEERWGVYGIPETALHMLPDDLAGVDAIELGCGTAYVCAWMARRGARPAGIDNSPRQLDTAARLQREHGVAFPLLLGNAERVPFPDASFDFAVSEYGAVLWADPEVWVREAARLLRPGGRLHVLTSHILSILAAAEDAGDDDPLEARLQRSQFRPARTTWPAGDSVEFHPAHGEWIRLFRDAGLEVEALLEPQVPEGATTAYAWATYEWARRWPIEEIWKVRKTR
jgi:SAM-dependent methyltransferase